MDGNKEPRRLFANADRPEITPDIILRNPQSDMLVIDTKYKDKASPASDDWCQIISYTTALNVPVGILVYSSSERRRPACFIVEGKSIWVYHFYLQDLIQEENRLVAFVRELV